MPKPSTLAGLTLIAASFVASPATAGAIELQGHRGARGLMPENTLPAFERALTIGVDVLELDVGVTKDGVVVISHDRAVKPDLARRDGDWIDAPVVIKATSLAELKTLDVGRPRPGGKVAKRFPGQQPVDGTAIPTLSELFDLVKQRGDTSVRFNIETKISPDYPDETLAPEAFAEALIAALRADGMERRAMVQSFDWRTLSAVNRLAPDIETVCLTAQQRWLDNVEHGKPSASPWLSDLDADDFPNIAALVKAAGCAVWSPYWRDVNAGSIAAAHALGVKVVVWTVNDTETMEMLVKAGVDGIITDYPDIGRQALK